jgi:hypothetical protein
MKTNNNKLERSKQQCHSRESGNPELKFKNKKPILHDGIFYLEMLR